MKEFWGSINPIMQNLIINFITIIILYNIIMWISKFILVGVETFSGIIRSKKYSREMSKTYNDEDDEY